MDIRRSLNSGDSFPIRKFKNRAPTSCSPRPLLSSSIMSFELHEKTAEKIDLEKCNFRNFGRSVTLTLTLDRVEVTLMPICSGGYAHTKLDRNQKKFVDVRSDGLTHLSSSLLGHL